jgi:hypothetical protein
MVPAIKVRRPVALTTVPQPYVAETALEKAMSEKGVKYPAAREIFTAGWKARAVFESEKVAGK